MIVTVTGANGFIGHHLVKDQLARGRKVRAVDVTLSRLEGLRGNPVVELIEADIRDRDRMRQAASDSEVVFHLASAHLQINLHESAYWDINVHGLHNLLQQALEGRVQRFVHVSSVGVYGNLKSLPANELSPCNPQSIYGKTKLAGEDVVRTFSEKSGLPVVIIRPAWVYGPGCPRTLKLYKALRNGYFVMMGKGDNRRHPIYVSDMIDVLHLAMEHETAVGELFVVAGNQALTTNELLDSFCTVLKIPKPKFRIPYRVGAGIASASETLLGMVGIEPPLSRRSLEFFETNNAFDVSKAKAFLGFDAQFSFEDGLRDSREWFVANA